MLGRPDCPDVAGNIQEGFARGCPGGWRAGRIAATPPPTKTAPVPDDTL